MIVANNLVLQMCKYSYILTSYYWKSYIDDRTDRYQPCFVNKIVSRYQTYTILKTVNTAILV